MIMTSRTPLQSPTNGSYHHAAPSSLNLEKLKDELSSPGNTASSGEKKIISSSWLRPKKPHFSESLKADSSSRENHINSSHWIGQLQREISEPGKAEHSIFADAEEEEMRVPSQDVATGDTNISGLELLSTSATAFDLATISLDNPGIQPDDKVSERNSTLEILKKMGIVERTENSVQTEIRKQFGDSTNETQGDMPLRRPMTPPSAKETVLPDQVSDDAIQEWDILSGRGGKSNHHPGNKRFRQVVDEMKSKYRTTNVKTDKTALSKAIVDYVEGYGGRFLTRKNGKPGHYRIMAKAESRKKTSQALRETKELKWKLNSSPPVS
mmetsp:Transcript_951/g.1177  ORF Transcript_951/g.1177 Transcript_951/m.1177 type:complete len:325 (+) Transcript_951:173-1147(+)